MSREVKVGSRRGLGSGLVSSREVKVESRRGLGGVLGVSWAVFRARAPGVRMSEFKQRPSNNISQWVRRWPLLLRL